LLFQGFCACAPISILFFAHPPPTLCVGTQPHSRHRPHFCSIQWSSPTPRYCNIQYIPHNIGHITYYAFFSCEGQPALSDDDDDVYPRETPPHIRTARASPQRHTAAGTAAPTFQISLKPLPPVLCKPLETVFVVADELGRTRSRPPWSRKAYCGAWRSSF